MVDSYDCQPHWFFGNGKNPLSTPHATGQSVRVNHSWWGTDSKIGLCSLQTVLKEAFASIRDGLLNLRYRQELQPDLSSLRFCTFLVEEAKKTQNVLLRKNVIAATWKRGSIGLSCRGTERSMANTSIKHSILEPCSFWSRPISLSTGSVISTFHSHHRSCRECDVAAWQLARMLRARWQVQRSGGNVNNFPWRLKHRAPHWSH